MNKTKAWGMMVGGKLRPVTYKTRKSARGTVAWIKAYFSKRGEKVRVVRVEVRAT